MESKLIAAVAFFVTAWYLAEFFIFAFRFKRDNVSVWKSSGMPDSFGVNGQIFYLGIVFGWSSVPNEIKRSYIAQIFRLRCLFVVGIMAYLALLVLTI